MDFEFVDAPNVRAIRDASLSLGLHPGENKEQIFAFSVRIDQVFFYQLSFSNIINSYKKYLKFTAQAYIMMTIK